MGVLDGKVAVVTGGTSGIGARTAELFVAEGAKVVIAGRRRDVGETLAGRLGPAARFIRTDVANEPDVKAMVDFAVTTYARVDCLLNNAGGPPPRSSTNEDDSASHGSIATLDELIGFPEFVLAAFISDRYPEFQTFGILVGWIRAQGSFCSDDFISGHIRGTETAREGRQSIFRESQDRAHAFFNLTEALVGAGRLECEYLLRLVAKQISCGVNAVDSKVPERTAAQSAS